VTNHLAEAGLSIIIPVFESPEDLDECLASLTRSTVKPREVIVVDDGSEARSGEIAAACLRHGARLIRAGKNRGPATARNMGAREASGEILLFLDADCLVHAETLERAAAAFGEAPELQAVFGSYDDRPAARGGVSEFRNLLHHYVHHQSAGRASTFWGGCGAIRRSAFFDAGGFDEGYRLASIEDVELGTRLYQAGAEIRLDPSIQVTHRKRWTLASLFRADLFYRAAPWTEAALRGAGLPQGLNFGWANRASVGLIGLAMLAVVFSFFVVGALCVGVLFAINWPVYRFIWSKRGAGALPASLVAHAVHYVAAFLGAVLGAVRHLRKRDGWALPAFALFLLVTLGFQIGTGAYSADFAGYPDEAAHFVTAVMVSEYLRTPFENPMTFAERYYLQYPKVGLGHWPPLGYLTKGIWMHGFGSTRGAALAFLLLCMAGSAWLIYELLWREAGRTLAIAAPLAFISNAYVQSSYQTAMMDVPALFLCLLAVLAFRQYVSAPSRGGSLLFGVVAGCALLVKQQSMVLALIPPVFAVAARRWDLFRRGDFWLAAVPAALLAGPWYGLTTRVFYDDVAGWSGWAGQGGAAAGFHLSMWWEVAGLAVAGLSAAAAVRAIVRPAAGASVWVAVLLSTVGSSLAFQVLNEPRHVLAGLAAQWALAALALSVMPGRLRVVGAAALVVLSAGWTVAPRWGYADMASMISAGPGGHVLLVSPNDGAVIASAAALQPAADGSRYWLRANKLMGEVGWSGRVRRMYLQTPGEVRGLLASSGINQVFVETGEDAPAFSALLQRAMEETAGEWEAIERTAAASATLFRRRDPLPQQPVSVFVPRLKRRISD
jgi:GT2 family glycosyltransferase